MFKVGWKYIYNQDKCCIVRDLIKHKIIHFLICIHLGNNILIIKVLITLNIFVFTYIYDKNYFGSQCIQKKLTV